MNTFNPPPGSDGPDDEAPLVHAAPKWDVEDAPLVTLAPRRLSAFDKITTTLAWIIIIAVVAINLFGLRRSSLSSETPAGEERGDVVLDLQARYMIGAAQLQGGMNKAAMLQQLPALETGHPERRLKMATLAGELGGPAEALKRLRGPDQREWSPSAVPLEDILYRLYRDYEAGNWDAPHVRETERDTLRRELDWYGELALAPADGPDQSARQAALSPARRTVFALFAAFGSAFGLAALGALGLVLLLIFWWRGTIHGAITAGTGRVAVWVETFVLYLVAFVGLSTAALLLEGSTLRLAWSGAAALLSLSVLAWPRIRGVPWSEIREAIGWTPGRGLLRELGAGIATYIMTLPILGVGVIGVFILMAIARLLAGPAGPGGGAPVEAPSHPIVPIVASGGLPIKIMILILAAVIAPIVEETMFRGVLYRHLRELTGRLGGVWSFCASTFLVSFVFAAIHPQGWLAVPALMAIATGLSLAREWRGTLIPSMVAHGISNGLVMTMLLVATS